MAYKSKQTSLHCYCLRCRTCSPPSLSQIWSTLRVSTRWSTPVPARARERCARPWRTVTIAWTVYKTVTIWHVCGSVGYVNRSYSHLPHPWTWSLLCIGDYVCQSLVTTNLLCCSLCVRSLHKQRIHNKSNINIHAWGTSGSLVGATGQVILGAYTTVD